jgi:rubrerythrin
MEETNMENASIYEVLQLAINLEEEGTKFYQDLAARAEGTTRETLNGLASDEIKHALYFKGLYDGLKDKPQTDYLFDEEVVGYLKGYAHAAAFSRPAAELETIKEALEEGILTEKKSIDYYENLLKYSKQATQEMLQAIIKEEQGHLVELEKLIAVL